MSNEEYWLYGPGYATLGRQAIAIAQFYLPVLQEYCALADQKEEQEKVVRRFVARVLRDIDARRIANQAVRDGYGGLWPHALQLLSDERTLLRKVIGDQNALCGRKPRVAPAQALAALLTAYFQDVVYKLQSPETPNRARVWASLKRMCEACGDAFLKDPADLLYGRYIEDLEQKVRAALAQAQREGRTEKNLPQAENPVLFRESLRQYLMEFHPALKFQSLHGVGEDGEAEFNRAEQYAQDASGHCGRNRGAREAQHSAASGITRIAVGSGGLLPALSRWRRGSHRRNTPRFLFPTRSFPGGLH